MNLESFQFNEWLDENLFAEKTVVVIDVFRATSVITTALAHGAKAIYTVHTVEKAMELSAIHPNAILGGERKMIRPEHFDCGNSPQEYLDCLDKDIILTTTNGTAALEKAKLSKMTLAASLLNATSVAQELLSNHSHICMLLSGRSGAFSLEDAICAGKIISFLCDKSDPVLDDFSHNLLILYRSYQHHVEECLKVSSAFHRLHDRGFADDVEFCKQEDIYPIVPICSKFENLVKITQKRQE